MQSAYLVCVTLHILAAMLWVGGMGFFAIVIVPVVRRSAAPEKGRELMRAAGARFAKVGWLTLALLVATGAGNLAFRGLLPALATAAFWSSSFGKTLALKLALVITVFLVSATHARAARASTSASGDRAGAASWGRVTLLLSLAVVVLGVFLVRGTP